MLLDVGAEGREDLSEVGVELDVGLAFECSERVTAESTEPGGDPTFLHGESPVACEECVRAGAVADTDAQACAVAHERSAEW